MRTVLYYSHSNYYWHQLECLVIYSLFDESSGPFGDKRLSGFRIF